MPGLSTGWLPSRRPSYSQSYRQSGSWPVPVWPRPGLQGVTSLIPGTASRLVPILSAVWVSVGSRWSRPHLQGVTSPIPGTATRLVPILSAVWVLVGSRWSRPRLQGVTGPILGTVACLVPGQVPGPVSRLVPVPSAVWFPSHWTSGSYSAGRLVPGLVGRMGIGRFPLVPAPAASGSRYRSHRPSGSRYHSRLPPTRLSLPIRGWCDKSS